MIQERRKRTRVGMGFDLTVKMRNETIEVKTDNISLSGVSFISDHRFRAGDPCALHLTLHQDVRLHIEGTVLRSDGRETIVSFSAMDEDTFYHLKRLLQFNAADPDRIDQELSDPAYS